MVKKQLVELVPQAKRFILSTVLWKWGALISQVIIVFVFAFWMEQAVHHVYDRNPLLLSGVVFCIAVFTRVFCERQSVRASFLAGADVKLTLRKKIYEKLLRLGSGYRNSVSTAGVVQVAVEGVEQLEIYFGKYLPQLFYSLLAPVTLFVILSLISMRTGVVLLICVPLIPLSIMLVQTYAKKLLGKYWGAYEELGDSFLENLQGLTTLKIYQADSLRAQKMDREAEYFRRITMKVLTMQLNSTGVMDVLAYGGAAVGMILAGMDYMAGTISLPQAIIVILLAPEFFIPLRLLGSFFHIAMNGMAASDRIFALLDLEEPAFGTELLAGGLIDIRMKELSFSYDGKRKILDGISFDLPAGRFVSLVGESGSGKSTVASILMGRHKRYAGSVQMNQKELGEYDEAEIMRHVALVASDSYIFKGTIADNLKMGNPDATEQQMRDVLRQVDLWECLASCGGTEMKMAERGSNFSGGQRQRLALARALLHDADIYIFDEATSNIDVESEEMIMHVIHHLAETKTVLLISHRLANVVESDCIYMLRDGVITEGGTHSELMKQQGDYYRLFQAQQELELYGRA